jgi:hypothetical protein
MKLDLQKDSVKLRKYIEKRICDYPSCENLGPGDDEDPIGLITLGYYAEQGGYANLIFDTRKDAEVDGEWTIHVDNETNTCPFPNWTVACETLGDGKPVSVIKHDGTKITLNDYEDAEAVQAVFGDMLVHVLTELRDDRTLSKLPLTSAAFMVVEEFDGRYFFPDYETRKTSGSIAR